VKVGLSHTYTSTLSHTRTHTHTQTHAHSRRWYQKRLDKRESGQDIEEQLERYLITRVNKRTLHIHIYDTYEMSIHICIYETFEYVYIHMHIWENYVPSLWDKYVPYVYVYMTHMCACIYKYIYDTHMYSPSMTHVGTYIYACTYATYIRQKYHIYLYMTHMCTYICACTYETYIRQNVQFWSFVHICTHT